MSAKTNCFVSDIVPCVTSNSSEYHQLLRKVNVNRLLSRFCHNMVSIKRYVLVRLSKQTLFNLGA